ncbi:hypothetical protein RYX36_014139 [Vicia faba]
MSSKGSLHFTKTSSLNFDSTSRSTNQDSALFSNLFNVDSIPRNSSSGFASHSVNSPVYDKPIYDNGRGSRHDGRTAAVDYLLGGFGNSKNTVKNERDVNDFDDLISGFGNSKPSSRQRCGDCPLLILVHHQNLLSVHLKQPPIQQKTLSKYLNQLLLQLVHPQGTLQTH